MSRVSLLFSSGPFSVLPIIAYAVGAVLVAYLALRAYRFVQERRNESVALPKPVSGSAAKSAFSFGRSTAWDWRRWSLPWSRSPAAPKGRAAAVANAKNLTVELLPTTGLPPPPTSLPTPGAPNPQLVDLSSPPTPPLTAGTSSSGFPASPRTPSPARYPLVANKNLQHSSFHRPPSPHTLLATTPAPTQHKRSRSLGGVPVRRLSGGHSSLRNKVDVEMHEFLPGHTRGTSREQLLIDFSSSGSSEDEGPRLRISPAASDIGVLPVSSAYSKVVHARPVPLVDLGDDETYRDDLAQAKVEADDEAWKWFGPSMPSTVRVYDARPATAQRVQSWTATATDRVGSFFGGQGKLAFPIPLRTENLVDVHSPKEELVALESSKTLVDLDDITDAKIETISNQKATQVLVDLDDAENDPFADDHAVKPETQRTPIDLVDVELVSQESAYSTSIATVSPVPVVDNDFHHPLEDLAQVDVKPKQAHSQAEFEEKQPGLLFAEADSSVIEPPALVGTLAPAPLSPSLSPLVPAFHAILDFAVDSPMSKVSDAIVQPLPALPTPGWSWDEVDTDPWGDHVVVSHESQVESAAGLASQDENGENYDLIHFEHDTSDVAEILEPSSRVYELVEKSPGGSLMPTVLDGEMDDEVPVLDLEETMEKVDVPHVVELLRSEDEEDSTPKPTPSSDSMTMELPSITIDIPSVPVIIVEPEKEVGHEETDDQEQQESFSDPDLLPLPDQGLVSLVGARLEETISIKPDADGSSESKPKATPSQMPTPPASPPISPVRFSPLSPRPPRVGRSLPASPNLRTKSLIAGGELMKARSASPRLLSLPLAVVLPAPTGNELDEQDDNVTPIAASSSSSTGKPLWAVSPADRIVGMNLPEEEEESSPAEVVAVPEKTQHSTSLPGSFPEHEHDSRLAGAASASSSVTTPTTIAARLASSSPPALFHPSARDIVRSPLDIALAMQLRPGLGIGADPAWMVRFLMAMYGWIALVASGQGQY